ncbi:MAG TPA: hemolysin family protein [Azospirillaceae bacterium]|nr:hemolysin family protein [Azospirillaceae bacterium]HRQ80179.1 hemolysin family protein [Azospirillaceae bacterium]
MSDISDSRSPREGADEEGGSIAGLFRNWFRSAVKGRSDATLRDAIEELIEEPADSQDALGAGEKLLLGNILKLRDRTVVDVMVPRVDIIAVDVETPLPELIRRFADDAHSRMPVYRENLDDVLGMVHIKDVLSLMVGQKRAELKDVLREVPIVAPSMPVLDLLLQMRESRQHMALVVDEFGGIDGLVTIEDLVEEIVGEIEDEHDDEESPPLIERPDGSLLADARVSIEDFEERVGPVLTDEEREDIDTLGGLVVSLAGRVPGRGELLRHASGIEFEVVDADPRRLKRLRVRNAPRRGEG